MFENLNQNNQSGDYFNKTYIIFLILNYMQNKKN